MTSPQKFYVQEISRKTNYRANWLPDKPLSIGDIGKLEDGIFTLYTTLEQQGIPLQTRSSDSSLDLDYSSTSTVKLISDDAADTNIPTQAVQAKLKLKIDFQNSKGVVFQMTASKKKIISNLGDIEKIVLDKYRNNEWNLGWVIVTETVQTDSATIIINIASNNTLEFEINGKADVASLNLADVNLGLKLLRETGSSTKIIAKANLTPLYLVKGIRDPLIGKTTFRSPQRTSLRFDQLKDLPFDPAEID
jgi:hypothetical protein